MLALRPAIFSGSEGKLTQAYQRVSMINILQILSSVHGGKSVASLASTSAVYLMSVYKDDGMFSIVFCILLGILSTMQQLQEYIVFSDVCWTMKSALLLS